MLFRSTATPANVTITPCNATRKPANVSIAWITPRATDARDVLPVIMATPLPLTVENACARTDPILTDNLLVPAVWTRFGCDSKRMRVYLLIKLLNERSVTVMKDILELNAINVLLVFMVTQMLKAEDVFAANVMAIST